MMYDDDDWLEYVRYDVILKSILEEYDQYD